MAAFIQKLFKNRKTVSLESQKASEKPQSNQPTEEDNRQQLRQQQERQLGASPEPSALAALAIEGVTSAIRLQAASQLNQEEHLQAVLKQAKGHSQSRLPQPKHLLSLGYRQQRCGTNHGLSQVFPRPQLETNIDCACCSCRGLNASFQTHCWTRCLHHHGKRFCHALEMC